MARTNLIGLSPEELKQALIEAGVPEKAAGMRARQLWNWTYVHGAREFAQMSNLAKDFRRERAEWFSLARPEIVTEQFSRDGTRKWFMRGEAGADIVPGFFPDPVLGHLAVWS